MNRARILVLFIEHKPKTNGVDIDVVMLLFLRCCHAFKHACACVSLCIETRSKGSWWPEQRIEYTVWKYEIFWNAPVVCFDGKMRIV